MSMSRDLFKIKDMLVKMGCSIFIPGEPHKSVYRSTHRAMCGRQLVDCRAYLQSGPSFEKANLISIESMVTQLPNFVEDYCGSVFVLGPDARWVATRDAIAPKYKQLTLADAGVPLPQ